MSDVVDEARTWLDEMAALGQHGEYGPDRRYSGKASEAREIMRDLIGECERLVGERDDARTRLADLRDEIEAAEWALRRQETI